MKRIETLLSLFVFFVAGISLAAERPVQVILLGGQSNMEGRAVYEELSQELKTRIDAVAHRVEVSSQGNPKQPLSFQQAGRHVRQFGPELFIGLTLAEENPEQSYLLIKTAVGGTSLYGAWSPLWTQEKANASEFSETLKKMKLYSDHQKSIQSNLQQLAGEGKSYKMIGMVWMQGEKDSRLKLSAVSYESNLKKLIAAYRADLNLPDLPFVMGQINCPLRGGKDYPAGPQTVRKAIASVAATVPHTAMIATSTDPAWPDYPKCSDHVHYNSEGQTHLGRAFAEKLMQLNH